MVGKLGRGLLILALTVVLFWQMPVRDVHAETEISTDTTWSGSQSLTQDVVITNGARLTIESGASVQMAAFDGGNAGVDPDRIEIIVQDGELMADGATFNAVSGFWFGIRVEAGGAAEITNCTIMSTIIAIEIYTANVVQISGNEIHNLHGPDGTVGNVNASEAAGIVVALGSPTISNNEIYDIEGGAGYPGSEDHVGGYGGSAAGIVVIDGAPLIEGNHIYDVTAGNGGAGGPGSAGTDGADGTEAAKNGQDGGLGSMGAAGGGGWAAYGIYLQVDSDDTILIDNIIDHVTGGSGGAGGEGGNGGAGGQGYKGENGDMVAAGHGGMGGDGGAAGRGGAGGNGGEAYGILSDGANLHIDGNQIAYINGGVAGSGGDGGDGGPGGAGGDGGRALNIFGSAGNGGKGGAGGTAGVGRNAGDAGDAYGYLNRTGGDFDHFSRNQIRMISGGAAAVGGDGGAGGAGGDGGAGGSAVETSPGNGGAGGAGGVGASAGAGSSSGQAFALAVYSAGVNVGDVTSSIFTQTTASRGGAGGDGGWGGAGGDGGQAGTNFVGGEGTDGAGGAGGDAGDGGAGGDSQDAYLILLQDTSVTLTNNTLFEPSANAQGGAAGAAGMGGEGGLDGSGNPSGSSGADGSDGSLGGAGASFGLSTESGLFGVYNNIFMAAGAANSTGIHQSDGPTTTAGYNALWGWGTAYSGVAPGVHDLASDPLMIDPDNGNLQIGSTSPCLDAGDNAAPGLPTLDYEGLARIFDGDGDGSDVVDMGAYEFYYENEDLFYLPLVIR